MQAVFGSRRLVSGATLPLNEATGSFNLQLPTLDPDFLYTVIIYDTTAKYLHFLEVNIDPQTHEGEVKVDYQPPAPPSGTHQYVINLYQQSGIESLGLPQTRVPFSLNNYVRKEGLTLIDSLTYYTSASLTDGASKLRGDPSVMIRDDPEAKFCRCVLDVGGKQPVMCNYERAWGEQIDGKTCYNPWAVCHSTIPGVGRPECNYPFEQLDDWDLRAYASMHRIPIPTPYDRQDLLDLIANYKHEYPHGRRRGRRSQS